MKKFVVAFMFVANFTIAYADSIKEKEFYYDFLKEHCLSEDKKRFYIHDESELIGSELDALDMSASLINHEALENLINKSKVSTQLRGIASCSSITFISTIEIEKGFENRPKSRVPPYLNKKWAGFFELYPDSAGVIYLSVPGFSQDYKYAVVLSNVLCGSLCGSKKLVQYKYENNFWIFDKAIELVKR